MDSSSPENPLEQFVLPERLERIKNVAANRTDALCIVLDDINNAHNISAVVRSADAFGIQNVYRIGGCRDYSSGISLGTERWISVHHFSDETEALNALHQKQYELVLLQAQDLHLHDANAEQAVPVHELPFSKRLALVFGNEKNGVRPSLKQAATHFAYIPMLGFVESLNISVAAAITLYCSMLSSATSERQVTPLDPAEQEQLTAQWLKQDIRGADLILERLAENKS